MILKVLIVKTIKKINRRIGEYKLHGQLVYCGSIQILIQRVV